MEISSSQLRDRKSKAKGFMNRAIDEMKSIIVTVSGYHGSERSKLIKLITLAGANYVGAMNRSTTHLVCWKFEGKKYELAKKFGTMIVNHRWIEDCVKQDMLISEYPYTLKGGCQIGCIELEVPGFSIDMEHVLTEDKLLSNKSSTRDLSKEVIDLETQGAEHENWDILSLLDENLFPRSGSSSSASLRRKGPIKALKRRQEASDRHAVSQPQADELRVHEYEEPFPTSKRLLRRSGNSHDNGEGSATSSEPSHKSGQLVKKNVKKEYSNSPLSRTNQMRYTFQFLDNEGDSAPNQSNDLRDEREAGSSGVAGGEETTNDGFMEAAEINGVNDMGSLEHLRLHTETTAVGITSQNTLHTEEAPTAVRLTSQDTYPDFSGADKELKEHSTGLSTQKEPSCAICYTDFSSIRGVLPCGHRFCFSCIQNWADQMVSKGKTSTCPLCKDDFVTITKVDDAAGIHQKIYSQTVPSYESTEDVYFLPQDGPLRHDMQISRRSICSNCLSGEVADLLIYCHMCNNGCIHAYCIDPPLFPWTCPGCRDRRMLF